MQVQQVLVNLVRNAFEAVAAAKPLKPMLLIQTKRAGSGGVEFGVTDNGEGIDPERLRTALDFARYAPTIRGAWRARGVRLVATDLDWAYGKGPEVRGSGEALLMVMAGRRAALDDLDGRGKAKLAQHI